MITPFKLKDNIYSVGSLNPAMRVFDIIMETEYGTSYNAFMIKGEKTALIDTVHSNFFKSYIENLKCFTNIEDIDYIVMNHTEPDHSGSVEMLLEMNPNITIVASMSGIKNLKTITNREFKSIIAKDGDILDLGNGLELQFIIAPNLHWPDSMFTYVESRKTLFTCDLLGGHFCEPEMFDDKITYPEKYREAFKLYYNAIFSPFKSFVLSGLKKIENLDFDIVCTSHGPILRSLIKENIDAYIKWSTKEPNDKKIVSIIYVSAYGYTKSMAEAAFKGLKEAGIDVRCYDAIKHDLGFLKEQIDISDGIFLGSPTINRDALKPIWDVLSVVDAVSNKGKPVALFGSYGWSGEALGMLAQRVNSLKLKLIGEPIKVNFKPSDSALEDIKEFAKNYAKEI